MSELFAEKRMDSRGVLVTRHVRRDPSGSSKSLGKASLPTLFRRDDRFPGNFKDYVKQSTEHLPKAEVRDLMATLNPDTFNALHAIGMGQDIERASDSSDNVLRRAIDTCVEEQSFALLNNVAIFAFNEEEPIDRAHMYQHIAMVKGLSQYQDEGDTERKDYSTASDEEVAEARLLMDTLSSTFHRTVDSCIMSHFDPQTGGGEGWYFSNPRMVEAITSNPERVPTLIEMINERHSSFKTDEDIADLCDTADLFANTMTVLHDGLL